MQPVEKFKTIFNKLNSDTLHLVEELYSPDVRFEDPLHEINGTEALHQYFENLYDGVVYCQFDFGDPIISGNEAAIPWVMHLEHARLRPGQRASVPGISHLRFNESHVTYHRDYFDVGKLLYERIPVLGTIVRTIKKRL